jgi:hypothetical protein
VDGYFSGDGSVGKDGVLPDQSVSRYWTICGAILTFGIRWDCGESHSGRPCREERVERLSLLGPQPGKCDSAIFARTSIIDYKQADFQGLQRRSYKDVMNDSGKPSTSEHQDAIR